MLVQFANTEEDKGRRDAEDGRAYLILSEHLELDAIAVLANRTEVEVKRLIALAKSQPK